jgi:hypothetical protein
MGKLDKLLKNAADAVAIFKGEIVSQEQTGIDWDLQAAKLSMPQLAVFNSRKQLNLCLAGQGSGKTYLGGNLSGYYIEQFNKVRGLIAANTYDQLNRSTLFRIREVWKTEFGWKEYNEYTGEGNYVIGIQPPKHFNTETHNFDRYNNIISFEDGAVVYVGSLDNYKALDGIEIGWAICDETKDTKEEAIKEVIVGRLRQKGIYLDKDNNLTNEEFAANNTIHTPFNPFYVLTSPAKVDWINEWFYLSDYEDDIKLSIFSETDFFEKEIDNRFVSISSTYHNAKNLPSNYITNQKSNLSSDLQDMLIYGCPFSKSGGEFYKGFNRDTSLRKLAYNPELPLHISFDFNVNPYITLGIYQIVGKTILKIDEMCLSSPRNTTMALCKEFSKKYQNHQAGLFIYGDPSGKRADTRQEQGFNDYTIIKRELEKYKPQLRLFEKAPAVVMRGNFMNLVFESRYRGITFLIDESCKHTLNDYLYLKEAPDGTKLKTKAKDKNTGVQYEKYGHTSDADEYFICKAFESEFSFYLRGGNKPKVRKGIYTKNNTR